MVDTSLNKRYKANKGQDMDFSPIPDGEYTLRVKEISPWKAETKNIKVIQRDEDGKALKDEKGDNITELVENCTFYNANAKLEVVGGAYDGKLVFHNLSTHPNMPFSIPAFLYALNMNELAASDIPTHCKGKLLIGNVFTDSYDKKIQNKETGLDEVKKNYINKIKSFKQLPVENTYENSNADDDLGV